MAAKTVNVVFWETLGCLYVAWPKTARQPSKRFCPVCGAESVSRETLSAPHYCCQSPGAVTRRKAVGAESVSRETLLSAPHTARDQQPAGVSRRLSRATRYRLFRDVVRHPWRNPQMVTCTYHAIPSDTDFNRHFGGIFAWYRDEFPGHPAVFRVEFQARNCPHLHILVEANPRNFMFVSAWLRITGQQGDEHASRYACHLGEPYSRQGKPGEALMAYVSGHSAKAGYQSVCPPGFYLAQWYRKTNLFAQDGERAVTTVAALRAALSSVSYSDHPISWGGWLGGKPASELLLSPDTCLRGSAKLSDGRYFTDTIESSSEVSSLHDILREVRGTG